MPDLVPIQGDRAIFPGNACVHCLRSETKGVEIVKVKGYVVRKVVVPFCEKCIELRRQRSYRQALFDGVAVTNSALLALAVGAWMYSFIASDLVSRSGLGRIWGILLGVLVALIVFGVMYLVIRPWSRRFRSAETKAVLEAVRIRDFDWETTTLEFADGDYAERFAQVNRMVSEADRALVGQADPILSRKET